MKISKETLDVLKNFSAINPNLVINEGNKLSTIAEAKNIMASTTVSETFPKEIGIYDLNEKQIIQKNLKQLLNMNLVDLQKLYDEIVKEYQSFIDKTGFYYFDMSSNNIMINKDDIRKFKIIDVLSIKKANFKTIEVNPLSVLLYHNIVKHNCLTEKTIKNKCSVFYSFAKDILNLEEMILKLKKLKSITLKGDK